MIDYVAGLLVILALANAYFVWHGARIYIRDPEHSPILLALMVTKLVIWIIGIFVAVLSARYLVRLPPLPASGYAFAVILVLVELLPAFIDYQMRRIERGRE